MHRSLPFSRPCFPWARSQSTGIQKPQEARSGLRLGWVQTDVTPTHAVRSRVHKLSPAFKMGSTMRFTSSAGVCAKLSGTAILTSMSKLQRMNEAQLRRWSLHPRKFADPTQDFCRKAFLLESAFDNPLFPFPRPDVKPKESNAEMRHSAGRPYVYLVC